MSSKFGEVDNRKLSGRMMKTLPHGLKWLFVHKCWTMRLTNLKSRG